MHFIRDCCVHEYQVAMQYFIVSSVVSKKGEKLRGGNKKCMDEMKLERKHYLCFNTVNLTVLLATQFNMKMPTL